MIWFTVLAVITAGLALGLPPDVQTQQQLHISSFAYRIAILILLVPYGIIWYAAFYSFAKLKEYTRAIRDSEDGRAFRKVMIGMGVLAFGLIIPTDVGLIFQTIVNHHPAFQPSSVVMTDYLGVITVLVTFSWVSSGTRRLIEITQNRPSLIGMRLFILMFTVLSVVFTYLVLRFHASHLNSAYYLNTGVLIITFIIPYLFAWFMALVSAYEISMYARHVKGLLYRRALRLLARGILVLIIGSIAIEFVENTFLVGRISHSLGLLLVYEYILLIIVGVGLVLAALGTKKLKKIEEV